jgi:lipopolysaccharide transport system ATP-binding protein
MEPVLELHQITKVYHLWKSSSARFWWPLMQRLNRLPRIRRLGPRAPEVPRAKLRETFHALHELDLEVFPGECLGIIGRNGSGKSTLLQVMSHIVAPTTGTVRVRGKLAALLELGSGFNSDFTGRENVYLNAAIHGLSRKETDAIFADIEAFAEIGGFMEQKVKTYSSGMVVRLAFSILVYLRPEILLIDEALAVGDTFFVQKCMRWMQSFKRDRTIVLVSHDMSAITRFCDRVVWMDEGRIRYLGAPKRATELYLESHYQEVDDAATAAPAGADAAASDSAPEHTEDFRQEEYRQCGETRLPVTYCFRQSAAFGEGHMRITDVTLREADDTAQKRLVRGGERVRLEVVIEAVKPVVSPIVGFGLKNRHGQELFHDNTFLTSHLTGQPPLRMQPGERALAVFEFVMPYLPPGEYSMFTAVAMGEHDNHTQQHWIHDAILLTSACDRICLGLVGLPMQKVEFYKMDPD